MKKERRNWTFRKSVYGVFKRFFDILLSLFGIIVSSPIMIIVAIAIKLDSKGPAIFKQERVGRYGKVFKVWKFRSMAVNNDVHDFSIKDQHTKVGSFIRKTSLDELPQLFNILVGKMSFIGPRPWILDYHENMTEEQRHRSDVRPGLTGLAQAKGRNSISVFDKINYDLEYIDNYSLVEDIKVIFITIKTVLSKEGADAGKNVIQNELEDLRTQQIPVADIKNAAIAK
ncbi:MAG: sugar transferase [Bacilli bacterium]|nr:sugar transferase [Bacilli bacterium]MBR4672259.1 sugar transferase [Bacilli bacterium]